ncbi:MAG: TldD/PmbA family protein [Archaeoglobaceae archaeon]|nr:TldD/PmbA family protein [Archaeoglobaceae archaeon]MCX8151564.1 TldD/PmbA family protein [Archaeoglobaceae archaeon]MDW8013158.1 TldD/PmbA family protein [Archaeoglobaceae archaeon]
MFYDIRRIASENFSINIENGKIEKPKIIRSYSKAFRVLKNGFWGYFAGNVNDDEGLKLAEKNAFFSGDSEILEVKNDGNYEMKVKIDPRDVPTEEKIAFLKDLNSIISADSVRISYFENIKTLEYEDSCGTSVSYKVFRCGIVLFAVKKEFSIIQSYSRKLMKAGGFEVLKNAENLAREVNEVISKLLKAKTPPGGEMNVVCDPSLAGLFVHEAFGHAAEGDHVLQGSSILKDKIGKRIACEEVNIVDDPTIQEFGFYPFDDEGVKAKRTVLVDKGILKSFLNSRETAKKLKEEPGNARADGTAFPIVRMSNTFIEPGNWKIDELLEECKNGVYLAGSRGGETDPTTGNFQFAAQYGYIIKNGEIFEMIRDVSISGNIEILMNVKVGKELNFDPGFCGKAGQFVPVSDGAPHILCRAIVGGS